MAVQRADQRQNRTVLVQSVSGHSRPIYIALYGHSCHQTHLPCYCLLLTLMLLTVIKSVLRKTVQICSWLKPLHGKVPVYDILLPGDKKSSRYTGDLKKSFCTDLLLIRNYILILNCVNVFPWSSSLFFISITFSSPHCALPRSLFIYLPSFAVFYGWVFSLLLLETISLRVFVQIGLVYLLQVSVPTRIVALMSAVPVGEPKPDSRNPGNVLYEFTQKVCWAF